VHAPPSLDIEFRSVTKLFGEVRAIDGIDLAVQRGAFVALLGPSGCGKTTCLRMIGGFEQPTTGEVRIRGVDMVGVPPHRRPVNMVFQHYALFPHLDVAENIAYGLKQVRPRIDRAEIARRVDEALEMVRLAGYGRRRIHALSGGQQQRVALARALVNKPAVLLLDEPLAALDLVGLSALADRRPAQLSGGQQQRVALARTLVIEPDVLLLDEPLSNLDAKLRVEMRAELKQLQGKLGITAVYVTHDQEEANTTADRMAVIDSGRIQQVGRPVDLYDRPANRFVATFLGTVNLVDGRIENGRFIADGADGLVLDGVDGAAGPACLSIRPQDVTLGTASAGVAATVAAHEFLGGVARYRLRAGAHDIVVDVPHRRSAEAHAVGTEVGLILDPRSVTVLR
jgi:ABC-type Fe3+/spermidine/putrescine transport system ATPase subunit